MLASSVPLKLRASGGKSNACAGEKLKRPATITQPMVTITPASITTARRPMPSMFRHSSVVEMTHTAAAIRLCCSGVIDTQKNCR